MKISIITVCYNAEKFIEDTILSVINQKGIDIEYIVIDGKSTDNTLKIIDKYNKSVTKLVSEPDNGIYDAMNKGIALATGEYINFMNAGDRFTNEEILSEIFNSLNNRTPGVVYGDAICVYENTRIIIEGRIFNKNSIHLPFVHQSSFIRRDIAIQYKFNLQFKIAADYNLFYNVYKDGYDFYYIDVPISFYDMNGVSSKNILVTYEEVAKSNGSFGSFHYYLIRFKIIIKLGLANIIPQKLIQLYRNYKYNK